MIPKETDLVSGLYYLLKDITDITLKCIEEPGWGHILDN